MPEDSAERKPPGRGYVTQKVREHALPRYYADGLKELTE